VTAINGRDDDYTPEAVDRDQYLADLAPEDTLIRAKGQIDGAATLSEAAAHLEEYARGLRTMEADGWQLTGPIEDDYGYVTRGVPRDGQPAERGGSG
jgi:hypothetical protein